MKTRFVFLIMIAACVLSACGPGSENTPLDLYNDESAIINGKKVTTRTGDGSRSVVLFLPVNSIGMATGICTATLLSDHSVLTAAHCYDKKSPTLAGFKIIFANNKGIATRDALKREGTYVVTHKDFRKTKIGLLNDLAIAFFEGGIPDGFEPVEIERDQKVNYQNNFLNVYGYGKNKDSREALSMGFGSAGDLYKAVIKLNGAYGLVPDRYVMRSKGNSQFVCSGDSGGGQFITINGKPRLIGVTSSVTGTKDFLGHVSCTNGSSTAMKVAYYAKWIDQVHADAQK
ncbi:S1 family peptidase [Bdellovibrio sp. HCB290]|uniref:S1 family peptidase n=1 Tax=Bdellovibrio sp. HCB290 TaxID=3394356 RepID=UPI0039B5A202